jgi:hypothetical protein
LTKPGPVYRLECMPRSLTEWHDSIIALQIQIDDLRERLGLAIAEPEAHELRNRLQILIAHQEKLFTDENVVDEPGKAWLAAVDNPGRHGTRNHHLRVSDR